MPRPERRSTPVQRSGRAILSFLAALTVLASVVLPVAAGADPSPTPAAAPAGVPMAPLVPHTQVAAVSAYWVVASDGGIFSFGGAPFYGSTGNIRLNKPVVAMAPTSPPTLAAIARSLPTAGSSTMATPGSSGRSGGSHLNQPIVGMAATADGGGYWLVAADGGIFAFGDAGFHGSMGGATSISRSSAWPHTGDGGGYWMVASDGGIFAFGDAAFFGSTGNLTLQKPIVGMAPTHDGGGYWMVASDGGIFAYGNAGFYGSLGNVPQSRPIVSMAATADGGGYWFTNNNGAVTAFGDATYWGSTPQVLNAPVVGMTQATGNGSVHRFVLPVGQLRLRHLDVPVPLEGRFAASGAPHHRDRPGRGADLPGQSVPGPGGGVGRRRPESVRLPEQRDGCNQWRQLVRHLGLASHL